MKQWDKNSVGEMVLENVVEPALLPLLESMAACVGGLLCDKVVWCGMVAVCNL